MLDKKNDTLQNNPKLMGFSKNVMFLANFVKIDMVKLKKNQELGVLTSGIKRDGHQKNPGHLETRELEVSGIRRDDCTQIFEDPSFPKKQSFCYKLVENNCLIHYAYFDPFA